jgi:hypothetical protein
MPALIRHRGFRNVEGLVTKVNDAALGLLVGARVARTALAERGPSAAETRLSELYSEAQVPDVSRFDFRVSAADAKLEEAERELCVMAVPFALSLYNDYLVTVSELLELGHLARPSKPAHQMMIGQLENHLRKNKVAVGPNLDPLLQLVKLLRNRIVHSAGIAGEEAISRWESLPYAAKQAWIKVTGQPMPFNGADEQLPWGGPEIRGTFFVVREGLRQINFSLQKVLSREFWADLAIHEYWVHAFETGTHSHRSSPASYVARHGYRSLHFSAAELAAASRRGKSTGWRPDLRPYWQRRVPPEAPLTQAITGRDITQGRIRIPISSKSALPPSAGRLKVKLREQGLTCHYNPEPQPGRARSGIVYVGDLLRETVVAGQQLSIFPVSSHEIGFQ